MFAPSVTLSGMRMSADVRLDGMGKCSSSFPSSSLLLSLTHLCPLVFLVDAASCHRQQNREKGLLRGQAKGSSKLSMPYTLIKTSDTQRHNRRASSGDTQIVGPKTFSQPLLVVRACISQCVCLSSYSSFPVEHCAACACAAVAAANLWEWSVWYCCYCWMCFEGEKNKGERGEMCIDRR